MIGMAWILEEYQVAGHTYLDAAEYHTRLEQPSGKVSRIPLHYNSTSGPRSEINEWRYIIVRQH